jgi:hypothetical protein
VDPTVRPRSQPLRRIPLALRDDVNKELSRMEGILEPIYNSEWVSNMVVVKKQAGGIRLCCDLSEVNDACYRTIVLGGLVCYFDNLSLNLAYYRSVVRFL